MVDGSHRTSDRAAGSPRPRRRVLRNAGFLAGARPRAGSCNPQCAPPPPAPAPVRYDVTTITTGLANPWDLAWTPTGTLLVTERPGRISAIGNGVVHPIGSPPDVVAAGEGGMMGIAVDPGFATNGCIYTCYMTAGDVRVVRFTVGADFSSLQQPATLIDRHARSSGRHSGCRDRIGPDGLLWVTDGRRRRRHATRRTPSRSAARCCASAPTARSRRQHGRAVPARRSTPTASATRRASRSPSDGTPYLIEHGSDRRRRDHAAPAGGNGGWNPVPGYNESVPMTDLGTFPGRPAPGVVVRLPDDRPVRRHVRDVQPVGHARRHAHRDGRAQGPAPAPRQRHERRLEPDRHRPGSHPRGRRGPGRQPLGRSPTPTRAGSCS